MGLRSAPPAPAGGPSPGGGGRDSAWGCAGPGPPRGGPGGARSPLGAARSAHSSKLSAAAAAGAHTCSRGCGAAAGACPHGLPAPGRRRAPRGRPACPPPPHPPSYADCHPRPRGRVWTASGFWGAGRTTCAGPRRSAAPGSQKMPRSGAALAPPRRCLGSSPRPHRSRLRDPSERPPGRRPRDGRSVRGGAPRSPGVPHAGRNRPRECLPRPRPHAPVPAVPSLSYILQYCRW